MSSSTGGETTRPAITSRRHRAALRRVVQTLTRTGWIACSARGRARRPSRATSTPGRTTRAGRIRSAIPGLRPRARRRAVPASCRRNKPFHQPLLTMRALSAGQRRGGRAFRSSIAGAAGRCCGFRPFGRRRGSAAPCRGLCCCGHCRPRYHARRGRRCFRHCHHRLRRGRRMRRARSPGPRAPRRGEPRYQRRPLLDVILRNVASSSRAPRPRARRRAGSSASRGSWRRSVFLGCAGSGSATGR